VICIGFWSASELSSNPSCWSINACMVWRRHTWPIFVDQCPLLQTVDSYGLAPQASFMSQEHRRPLAAEVLQSLVHTYGTVYMLSCEHSMYLLRRSASDWRRNSSTVIDCSLQRICSTLIVSNLHWLECQYYYDHHPSSIIHHHPSSSSNIHHPSSITITIIIRVMQRQWCFKIIPGEWNATQSEQNWRNSYRNPHNARRISCSHLKTFYCEHHMLNLLYLTYIRCLPSRHHPTPLIHWWRRARQQPYCIVLSPCTWPAICNQNY